ncbi:MAG: hypothetical protein D6719_09235 [Candidatus Dadabacteria bacterium]|nr:MAG: hypothetical protein D6719_09235 [Candidatus Dadabacteria bacterium]
MQEFCIFYQAAATDKSISQCIIGLMAMFSHIFRALNDAGIDYLVVGGLAVVLHGYARITRDVDLMIGLDHKNCEQAIKVFESLGYYPRLPVNAFDFADSEIRKKWLENKNMKVMTFISKENPLVEIDVFAELPHDFPDMLKRAESKTLEGILVPVASIDDIITLKESAGRAKDLEDIEALKIIKKNRDKED